jgi:hypothetical protein
VTETLIVEFSYFYYFYSKLVIAPFYFIQPFYRASFYYMYNELLNVKGSGRIVVVWLVDDYPNGSPCVEDLKRSVWSGVYRERGRERGGGVEL